VGVGVGAGVAAGVSILGISSRTLYRKLREYETQAEFKGLTTEA